MSSDWADNPEFKEYAKRCRETLEPMVRDSYVAVTLIPADPNKVDVKLAVELGYMILLDKPIIAIVARGPLAVLDVATAKLVARPFNKNPIVGTQANYADPRFEYLYRRRGRSGAEQVDML